MAITKESVFECANQLLEDDITPTLAKVRKALGGGSYTTISEFMAEWRKQNEAANQPKPLQIPDAVLDSDHNLLIRYGLLLRLLLNPSWMLNARR